MYKEFIKPLIDFTVALVVFILLSPVFVFIALVLLLVNRGTPFFLQPRPGKNERIFRVIKFKTMSDEKDVNGKLLSDSKRMTIVGNYVRKTSLDEIPQLLNVLKGDMSLVGPRPLLVEYLALYNEKQKSRHDIKPGITGWAQVNGRNTLSWESKFEHDLYYVKNCSVWLDLKIIFMTIQKVFLSHGITAPGTVSAEKFKGTSNV